MINPQSQRTEREPFSLLRVPIPIDVVQLQDANTTVFTADDDADFHIEHLVASNVSGGAATVTVYLVPDGGSPGASNMVVHQHSVSSNAWATIYERDRMGLLQPGMSLVALCSVANAINMYGYGYSYQGQYST